MSNPFAVDHAIISLFDVESQIFVPMATRASQDRDKDPNFDRVSSRDISRPISSLENSKCEDQSHDSAMSNKLVKYQP